MATLFPPTGNGVMGGGLALASGTLVSGSDTFRTQSSVIEGFAFMSVYGVPPRICPGYSQGWCPLADFMGFTGTCSVTAYVGLAFKIKGQIHCASRSLQNHVDRLRL